MQKIKKKYAKYIVLVLVAVFIFCAFDVRLKTVHYNISSNKIKNGFRIVLLTDLHSCKYGKGQKTLIDAVKKEKPDLVLLGGDIFDDKIDDSNTEISLKAISKDYPCFYVTGNHEYWSRRSSEQIKWLKDNNIYVLDGENKVLNINGDKINLGGINDPDKIRFTGEGDGFYTELQRIKDTKDENLFSILLAHRPSFVKKYLDYGFDIVLCGHAHGGQWRIPYILNGLFAPDEGFFPKYAGGFYDFSNGQMIVSRGLARESTRVPRIFNRPELVVVDVKSK